jgi:TonB family protein
LIETQHSAAALGTNADIESTRGTTVRLVIRARILSDPQPPQLRSDHPNHRRTLALAGVGLLVLLAIAIGVFTHHSSPAPTVSSERADQPKPSSNPPVVLQQAPPIPAAPEPPPMPDLNKPTNEVLPTVSRSSLQTIRGTIKVIIRVQVNQDGTVRSATSQIPGPSRYFERVALQSAKKWTFVPTNSQQSRTFSVHFDFARTGVAAHSEREARP